MGLPVLDCIKVKHSDSRRQSLVSTTPSVADRSPCNIFDSMEWSAMPTEDVARTGSRQHSRRFSRPYINMDLVRKQGFPLANASKSSQCQRLSERFEVFAKLGEGSCAVVYRAIAHGGQQEVALKVTRTDDDEHVQHVKNEHNLLQRVNHPKIIKVFDFFTYALGVVLVEEFFDGKSRDKIVTEASEGCISEACARQLVIQLLDAVAYLHEQEIIHRDVKAQNILLAHNLNDLRLVDFNSATFVADGSALTLTGTREYMPPEVLTGNSPSEGSDVWASGLCFHFMLIGCLPAKVGAHVQLKGPEWEKKSKACKDILRQCLEIRRDLRPKASEILACCLLQER